MKIQSVKACYPSFRKGPGSWRSRLWQIVVRVESDSGLIGYGYGGGGEASLPIVNGHFHELLEGSEINSTEDIESIWDRLYFESIPYGRKGIAMMALSGVDLTLWDLLGKAEQKPVAALISDDLKTDIPCYGTGGDPEYHAECGFSGTKTPHRWTGARSDVDRLLKWAEVTRSAMGPDRQLMVDAYNVVGSRIYGVDGSRTVGVRHLLVRGCADARRSGGTSRGVSGCRRYKRRLG